MSTIFLSVVYVQHVSHYVHTHTHMYADIVVYMHTRYVVPHLISLRVFIAIACHTLYQLRINLYAYRHTHTHTLAYTHKVYKRKRSSSPIVKICNQTIYTDSCSSSLLHTFGLCSRESQQQSIYIIYFFW